MQITYLVTQVTQHHCQGGLDKVTMEKVNVIISALWTATVLVPTDGAAAEMFVGNLNKT